MPNWVSNTLAISGEPAQIDALLAQVSKPHPTKAQKLVDGQFVIVDVISESPFSFWNIVSPDDVDWYFKNSNWYDWNVDNWGTKWDAVQPTVERDSEDRVHIRFDTAWGQPVEAIESLAKQYPSLKFSLEYEEEQGWGGEIVWKNGVGTQVDDYDIPESHADYEERDRPCWCEHSGEPEFDDCPTPTSV